MSNLPRFLSPSTPIYGRFLMRCFKSSNSRTARKPSTRNAPTTRTRSKPPAPSSLYKNISDLIGLDKSATEGSSTNPLRPSDGTFAQPTSSSSCSQDACRNSRESTRAFVHGEDAVSGGCESKAPNVEDVSQIVHEITNIVRSEKSRLCMERRLEELNLSWSSDVAEKVLKRCFKVGHLARRLFNWLKLRPDFCHSTEMYNVMMYIAGEAKDFDLVEKLVDDMDVEMCPKNIKTWTILISQYGKAKQIAKALRTFEAIRKSGCQVDHLVYEAIIRALCYSNKPDLAMVFYKEMIIKNMVPEKKIYEILMDSLASSGDIPSVRVVGVDMMKISDVPESEVYIRILRSFCISGKIEEAKQLFEEIKMKDFVVDSDVFEILVKGLCRTGKMDEATDLVKAFEQESTVSSKLYGCLVNGFLGKGDIPKSLELLQSMKKIGRQPMLSTYTEIIQHLFKSDGYQKACELYEEMLRSCIEPDIVSITSLVAGHVQHNQISKAWEVFETMKKSDTRPTVKAYSVFINELCKVSKPQEALKLLKEMSSSRIKVSDALFNLVISSFRKVGELEKARKVEQMLRLSGLDCFKDPPACQSSEHQSLACEHETISNSLTMHDTELVNVTTFDDADLKEVCRIISSRTDWNSIQEVLESSNIHFTPSLVEATVRRSQRHSRAALHFFFWIGRKPGYIHTTETYNSAIKLAGSAKDFKHMRYLFRDMKRSGVDVTINTWTIMISQYGRAGLTEMALDVVQTMKNEGYQLNSSAYKYIVVFLCGKKGRRINEAIKIFREMIHAGYMPDKEMFETYLSALCECKKLSDAQRSVNYLISRGFEEQVGYSLLVKSLSRAGQVEEALKVANHMESVGCTKDQYIYGSIIHALLREGRLAEALDKVEEMKKAGIPQTTHTHTSLIVHFFKVKNIAKAMEIFKSMKDEGCEPTIITYSALIRGFMNMEMIEDAWNIYHRIKLKGPFPDFETYSMFMNCLCKLGKSEDALQLLHEMLDRSIIPSAMNFQTVMHGLNREGKSDLARNVLKTKLLLKQERMFSL